MTANACQRFLKILLKKLQVAVTKPFLQQLLPLHQLLQSALTLTANFLDPIEAGVDLPVVETVFGAHVADQSGDASPALTNAFLLLVQKYRFR
jgi:hypothetical protein